MSLFAARTPGVEFQWVDRSQAAPLGRRTDVAGLMGIAARGPLHTPVRVETWSQFTNVFGGHIPVGYLAYAVEGFFANGGKTCWVVRVADPDKAERASAVLLDNNQQPALRLIAKDPGTWARQLNVAVDSVGSGRFNLTLSLPDGSQERWERLSLDKTDTCYVETVFKEGSLFVTAEVLWKPNATILNLATTRVRLTGGCDGLASLSPNHLGGMNAPPGKRWGLACLEDSDEISLVAIPDLMNKPRVPVPLPSPRPTDCRLLDLPQILPPPPAVVTEWPPDFKDDEIKTVQQALLSQCLRRKDRIALLDPPVQDMNREQIIEWRQYYDTSYAALYFPWLLVPDPLGLIGLLRAVPPSGHIAGIIAATDLQSGVHQPPANVQMRSVQDLTVPVDAILHGDLNTVQVNAIRAYPGRGLRLSGARTLSSDSAWRYINVRRLLIWIEQTIEENAQRLVFEPNDAELWRDLDRVARSVLDRLWQAGRLDGATPEEAYSVQGDVTTTPAGEIALGRAICQIGVQPPWPAEFIRVRIGFTEAGTTITEGS
jgi:hypothetical protein